MSLTEINQLKGAAASALGQGDYRRASHLFDRVVAGGGEDAGSWFGWSVAHRHLGEVAEERRALERALQLDPNYVPALISLGDMRVRAGDQRAAASYYGAAVRVGRSLPSMPADWRSGVERAISETRRIAAVFESHLRASLKPQGLGQPGTERFGRAMDLLLGKRRIYLQEPKHFYFPELPQIEFYERERFPWIAALEAATPQIRDELGALLADRRAFEPYIKPQANRPVFANPLLNDPAWSACYLIKDGNAVTAVAGRCPATMTALQAVPLCRIADRTPSVLFSLLQPGTHIRPHHGFTNARLICHLPLLVPGDCRLRVGNEVRAWHPGQVLVFDDSIEHEAWNRSQELRVVLLFDIWRPELTALERSLVAAALASVKQFEGGQDGWRD
ncbi:MAG: aspartyl/asparaginyl beta-hydroxylase domain-containing protein [Gammaproteobacteria bacterium]|nr:aspartyl/asparaginyl beta-hydroxylase domain-containing protein [Gammaproteobacteria bacterium]MBV9696052.1 aspartyl/asparaginyl beta-hydroxylase domain-containing protein [Gammaproteobacteria bacterium]MBV9914024.1 aspartyl/asparaginyl beta-hydroxylase domain-containing protein [Nevskiaceae bacterium]